LLRPHELSWLGVFIGLSLHTALDGIAVAASVSVAAPGGTASWCLLGLGTFLGVVLHKPLDALSITSLMAAGGWSVRERQLVNAAFALMCPLAGTVFYLTLGPVGAPAGHDASYAVGCALAFSAGVFVCIALADLLPELQFHTHDRLKLSAALLAGVGLAWGVVLLERQAHRHSHLQDADLSPPAVVQRQA